MNNVNRVNSASHPTLLLILIACLSACTKNQQLRTELTQDNCLWGAVDCSKSIIENYAEYDLAFVEFTERGNLYDRNATDEVFSYINTVANTPRGAAVFVFVHGWQHNADFDDSNVRQFREFLSRAAENEVVGKRKVVGVFLGWRGELTPLPVARGLSYWARKSVAEEVGAGGTTEVFSQLHKILVTQFQGQETQGPLYKNTYVIIGHSFGGAIVLSALHDVLLQQLVEAKTHIGRGTHPCKKIRRFADALLLLNPAIEANKVILLKEVAARCQFGADQPKLLHVLSSDGDVATKVFFPLGQLLNLTSTLSPKKLARSINGHDIILDESKLDRITVGNLKQIRTAYLSFNETNQQWSLAKCADGLEACGITSPKQQKNYLPANDNDPLSFTKTDRNFIRDHNDVFGCYVQSYIAALIFETQSIDKGYSESSSSATEKPEQIEGCNHLDFEFKQCFNNQLSDYDCEPPR